MPRKRISLVLLALFALTISACTRSASTAPVDAPTQDPIESIFSTVATQTALAASGAKASDDDSSDDGSSDDSQAATSVPTDVPTSTPESTPTNTPAPTSEPGAAPISYTLHRGENPYCLARRFDVNPDTLIEINNFSDPSNLSVGTLVTIPTDAGPFGGQRSLRTHPTSYTATGVDSLYSIACVFGDVWPENIAEANGKSVDYQPTPGELLQIP